MELKHIIILAILGLSFSSCCNCDIEDYEFHISEIESFEITSHQNEDLISCPNADFPSPCSRNSPMAGTGACQFEVKGTSKGIFEQKFDGFIYILVKSTTPPEGNWHIQYPNTAPDSEGNWTLNVQFGSEMAPFVPCENDKFKIVAIVTAYKDTMDGLDTIPEPYISNLKAKGVKDLLATIVIENLTVAR